MSNDAGTGLSGMWPLDVQGLVSYPCAPTDAGFRTGRLRQLNGSLLVELFPLDAGDPTEAWLGRIGNGSGAQQCPGPPPGDQCSSWQGSALLDACPACLSGERLADFAYSATGLIAFCEASDGGSNGRVVDCSTDLRPWPTASSLAHEHVVATSTDAIGTGTVVTTREGHVFVVDPSDFDPLSLTLDATPDTVVGRGSQLAAAENAAMLQWTPPIGFFAAPQVDLILGGIRGLPDWAITSSGAGPFEAAGPVVRLDGSVFRPFGPRGGRLVTTPGGNDELLLSAGQALYSARLDGGSHVAPLRLVPPAGASILSIAALPGGPGEVLQGYTLTKQRALPLRRNHRVGLRVAVGAGTPQELVVRLE